MKVVLISLYGVYSFGPRHLYGTLTRNGYATELVFFKHGYFDDFSSPLEKEYEITSGLLKKLQPDIVGLSIGSFFLKSIAERLSQQIKDWFLGPIIWGGTYPTLIPEKCIPFADFVCIGEGEETLLELVSNLSCGKPVDLIKNLWVKKKDGQIIKNPIRPISPVLEYFPDFSNKNKYFIENNKLLSADPRAAYSFQYYTLASHGCPFFCNFCVESSLRKIYGGKKTIRKRSVQNVISELITAKKALPDTRLILFSDEIFPTDQEWLSDFTREYKRHINLPFKCFFTSSLIKGDILASLKEAGLSYVEIGVQSGSKRIHDTIFRRPESLLDVSSAIKECNRHNIVPTLDFIVDNPYETPEDKRETLNFLHSLTKPFDISFFSFFYIPKTELTDNALREGFISQQEVEKAYQFPPPPLRITINKKRARGELMNICFLSLSAKQFIPRAFVKSLMRSNKSTRFPLFYGIIALTMLSGYVYMVISWLRYSQKKSIYKDAMHCVHYIKYILRTIR